MKAKPLFQSIIQICLIIVIAGNALTTPSQTVSAKPLSAPYNCVTSQTQILTADCNVLLALYNNTSGANWQDDTGWLVTSTPCSWYGVTCTGNRVTSLLLDTNGLSGSMPPSLGNLTKLTQLSLSDNNLTGPIPTQLGNLANLTTLYLHTNQLSGMIPATLGNLQYLQELYLGGNQLSGQIPATLGSLPALTLLVLGSNQLEGAIPAQLGNLPYLTVLILGSNQLEGTIPTTLGNLDNLTGLYLDTNMLTGPIPAELGNLTSLTALYLGGNQLSGNFPATLTNLINLTEFNFDHCAGLISPNQTVTDFINNFAPGWPTECLATVTSVSPNIGLASGGTSVTISGENLGATSAVAFGGTPAASFIVDSGWQVTATSPAHAAGAVDITITNPYGDGTATDAFTYTPPFTGCASPAQTQIPEAECAALVALYNSTNGATWQDNAGWLQTNTPCNWNGVICNGSNVVILSLGKQNSSGAIPAELGNLTSLTGLYLGGNQLSGEFPATIVQLVNLTQLDFDTCQGLISHDQNVIDFINNLVGPSWLTDCLPYVGKVFPDYGFVEGGTSVTMSGANFTTTSAITFAGQNVPFVLDPYGAITVTSPAHAAGAVDITITNLYGEGTTTDAFTYSLPFTGCAAPAQTQIPEQECATLTTLYNSTDGANWHDNPGWLQTNTPCNWLGVTCNGSNVVKLSLEKNNLSGQIPTELSNLTKLEALFLSANRLTGPIPAQLSSLTNLTWLYLPWNELSGSIPTELGNLSYLVGLNLSYNQLSGVLPEELGNLRELEYLSLYNNDFSGEFPASIVNLTHLNKFSFDCELTSSSAAVTAFINNILPGWKNNTCPILLSPTEGAVLDNGRSDKLNDVIWDFRWSAVENASKYRLYVFYKEAPTPLIDIGTLSGTSYRHVGRGDFIPESARHGWYWQVRAYINGRWGEWSDVRAFSVEPLNSDAPDVLSKNGGFNTYLGKSPIPTSWSAINFSNQDGKVTTPKKEGSASVEISGIAGKTKTLTQTLVTGGWAGDIFVFSYWAKGKAIPKAGLCQAQVLFYSGSVLKGAKTLNCPAGITYHWKQAKLNFTAPAAYTKVLIKFTYSKPGGIIWFDAISLVR